MHKVKHKNNIIDLIFIKVHEWSCLFKETSRTSHVSWTAFVLSSLTAGFLLDKIGLNPFLWHKSSRFLNVAIATNSQRGEGWKESHHTDFLVGKCCLTNMQQLQDRCQWLEAKSSHVLVICSHSMCECLKECNLLLGKSLLNQVLIFLEI